jgi:galactoside 2-L-fucosyltransferase 1/2
MKALAWRRLRCALIALAATAGAVQVFDNLRMTGTLRPLFRGGAYAAGAAAAAAAGGGRRATVFHSYEGPIGNQLFQWASVQGLASRANLTTCMQGGDISALFDGVGDGCRRAQPWGSREVSEEAARQWHDFALTREDTVLFGSLQSYRYFDAGARARVRFKGVVWSHAKVVLQAFGERVLVGVHVQRHGAAGGEAVTSAAYVENAMAVFAHKFKQVGFVVLCDDAAWCARQAVLQRPHVHVLAEAQQPVVAMAILAACDHAVITTGTLGWWAAYLGPDSRLGGMVVYASGARAEERPQDFFPPHWIAVRDTSAAAPPAAQGPGLPPRREDGGEEEEEEQEQEQHAQHVSGVTIVTAFYGTRTQPPQQQLLPPHAHARNVLSLQDALVVFTSADLAAEVLRRRAHARNRTHVVVMPLEKAKVVRDYGIAFWSGQTAIDPGHSAAANPHQYVIDNEKPAFVHTAATLNPFRSSHFLWVDVDLLTADKYNGLRLVTDTAAFGDTHQVLMLDTRASATASWIDAFFENEDRVACTMFGGSVQAIARLHVEYYKTLALSTNSFVGRAARLLWRTCKRERSLCNIVENDAWLSTEPPAQFLVVYFLRRLWSRIRADTDAHAHAHAHTRTHTPHSGVRGRT